MHTVEAMGPCESLTPCVSVRDIHHPRDALQLTPPPQVEGSPSSWTRARILPEETRAPYTCFPSFPSSWARVRCWQSETPTPDWAGEAGRESSGDTADCSGEGGGSSQRCPVTGAGGANHGMHTCPAVVILQEMFGSIIWVVPNSLILPKFSELPISSQFIFCLIHHNWVSLLGVSSRAQNMFLCLPLLLVLDSGNQLPFKTPQNPWQCSVSGFLHTKFYLSKFQPFFSYRRISSARS